MNATGHAVVQPPNHTCIKAALKPAILYVMTPHTIADITADVMALKRTRAMNVRGIIWSLVIP